MPESGARRPEVAPDSAPQGLIGEYELHGELGRGGAGVVYRAWQPSLHRMVALKVILDEEHTDEEQRTRFLREAKALARLRHEGIIQIHEVGEHEGRPFMVLELVPGGSLHDWLDREPKPWRWAVGLTLQLARTIAYCHAHGIVHRDLKPANVLLPEPPDPQSWSGSKAGHDHRAAETLPAVRLTDFGLARELFGDSDLTRAGAPMGTPAYMAPEQADGDVANAGPQADIYALGAILYRLLTGRPPFASADPFQTFHMVINDDPRPPREAVPDLPRDVEVVCLKCLRKAPADRYASADQLADDLERLIGGAPVNAAPPGIAHRVFGWMRRRPLLGLSLVLGIAFYALHLFAMSVLDLPRHQGIHHWHYTGLITAVICSAFLAERLYDSPRRRVGEMIYALMPVAAMTIGFFIDHGPQSAALPFYLVMVAISPIIAPRVSMVGMVTVACGIGYGLLLAHAAWITPANRVPIESAIAFVLCLLAMGMTVSLTLKRNSA